MKLSKLQALTLVKILSSLSNKALDRLEGQVEEIQEALEEFLVGDESDDEDEEEEDDYEEDEDDSEEEEDSDSEEDYEEPEEEDDEEDEEDEERLDTVDPLSLHDLKSCKATLDGSKVTIEFEDLGEGDAVDVLVSGDEDDVPDVTQIKRLAKELHVKNRDNEWVVFEVSRFPKEWTSLFPLGELLEVLA